MEYKSTKEIAKQIRQDLKNMRGYKFSVTMKSFSGGSSIGVHVMESPIRMIRNISEIPECNDPVNHDRYTMIDIAKRQLEKYHQLNYFNLQTVSYSRNEYKPESWNNGVFLTEAGHNDLKEIVAIVQKYHRDSSDSSIDYFNCNFYFDISLGKWDNEFKDGV